MVAVHPIRTELDYEVALERLNEVFDAPAGTPESDEADVLAVLIEAYEAEHHTIGFPDPIAAVKIRMEEQGLRQQDLADRIGSKSLISEVLNRRKRMSLSLIRRLADTLSLPIEVLAQDYRLQ